MPQGSRNPSGRPLLDYKGDVDAEIRKRQFDRAGGSPNPVTVAVALRQTLGALLAKASAGQAADLQLHRTLRGKADYLAMQVSIRALPLPRSYTTLRDTNEEFRLRRDTALLQPTSSGPPNASQARKAAVPWYRFA